MDYCWFNYFHDCPFSCIEEIWHFRRYLISWFCQSPYTKPIENVYFVEHLNSFFTRIYETHEKCYPTNAYKSKVIDFRSKRRRRYCYSFVRIKFSEGVSIEKGLTMILCLKSFLNLYFMMMYTSGLLIYHTKSPIFIVFAIMIFMLI